MSNSAYGNLNEELLFEQANMKICEKIPCLDESLNIAVIGKVSSGKSSLINALLKLNRRQALGIAKVGATSGITTKPIIFSLDDKVHLIDSPGLDDVRAKNSEETKELLKHIDIGIFVVTGSSDASQKRNLEDLKNNCDIIFVVLNKVDEWDGLDSTAVNDVVTQWKNDLKVDKIYPTCTKGYDPKSREPRMHIRGVDQLRTDIEEFLRKKKKNLLLERHMAEKKPYAIGIITTALTTVAVEALLPGSIASITATQAAAIVSLNYLYTGEVLSPKAALSMLPVFLAESARPTLFLFVKSFLPPTGIIDVAAVSAAVVVTLALLTTVNFVLSSKLKIDQKEILRINFKNYYDKSKKDFNNLGSTDIKNLPKISEFVKKFLDK
jgi:small GTP-binding protein